jgi:hypothetical protein
VHHCIDAADAWRKPRVTTNGAVMGAGTPFPLGARIADCLSAEDLAKIRALISTHERRLQGVDPALLTTLIVEAMRADLAAELSLEAALTRAAIVAVNFMRANTTEP